jgi:CheY-like chemotaxis protein
MAEIDRILLVEDDHKDIELILSALAENRLANEVQVVRDGEEALDYLYRRAQFRLRHPGNPAVVLLDLKLPKIHGLDVLKQIKSDEKLKTIPVVILTSSTEAPDLEQSYHLGVNAYVVKPVDFAQFVTALKQIGLFWAVINEPPPGSYRREV